MANLDKLQESEQWQELGDWQVQAGNNTAADSAYALADQKRQESRWTIHVE